MGTVTGTREVVCSQPVALGGYRVVEGLSVPLSSQNSREIVKVVTLVKIGKQRRRRYDPMTAGEAKFLYRQFADVECSEEGIQRFAATFGLLGIGRPFTVGRSKKTQPGEAVSDWYDSIRSMAEAVRLWSMIQARDRAGLRPLIEVSKDGASVVYRPEPNRWKLVMQAGVYEPDAYTDWDRRGRGAIKPASVLLARWVNAGLWTHCTHRLLWDSARGHLSLRDYPKNLLGAMWLQLAIETANPQAARVMKCQAPKCGRYFPYQRSSRSFCSETCAKRALRSTPRTKAP